MYVQQKKQIHYKILTEKILKSLNFELTVEYQLQLIFFLTLPVFSSLLKQVSIKNLASNLKILEVSENCHKYAQNIVPFTHSH